MLSLLSNWAQPFYTWLELITALLVEVLCMFLFFSNVFSSTPFFLIGNRYFIKKSTSFSRWWTDYTRNKYKQIKQKQNAQSRCALLFVWHCIRMSCNQKVKLFDLEFFICLLLKGIVDVELMYWVCVIGLLYWGLRDWFHSMIISNKSKGFLTLLHWNKRWPVMFWVITQRCDYSLPYKIYKKNYKCTYKWYTKILKYIWC